jgi:hypothetical protein
VNQQTAQQLFDLARRVKFLEPDIKDAERFHVEKSEIENGIKQVARSIQDQPS